MPLPFIFGTQPGPTVALSDLDDNFAAVGELTTIPCMVAGTNALTMTALANVPTIGSYQNYLRVSGIAAATNTGAMTAAAFGLAAIPVLKDTGAGPVPLVGGEVVADNTFTLVYDAALSGGSGGFHLDTRTANAATAGITQLTGAVLAGPGTGAQVTSFGPISASRVLANLAGGAAPPIPNTVPDLLDAIGMTQGSFLTRGASVWGAAVETAWVPTVTFGGASAGVTYGTQIGQFYAIGFLNFAMFSVVLTSKGSSTGAAAISLPAAAGGGGRVGGGMIVNYSNLSSLTVVPWVQIAAGGSTGSIVIAGSGTVTALADTNFTNTSAFSGFVFYLTG